MPTTVSTIELSSKLGEVVDRTFYRCEGFVVERKGRPLAVIVPLGHDDQFQVREHRFDRALERVRECIADLSPEEIEEMVEEAVTAMRRQKRAGIAAG